MADRIIHKRNLTTGNIPTTSSIKVGELAINVADGKLFLYQSGSIANKIITVGESASYALTSSYSNTSTSASYALSGSYTVTASYSNTSTSASHAIYADTASFSDRTTQIDVYVLNQSGQNIAKGVVVRITGSNNSSDIPRIITASYENDNNSANTLGITTTAIANGAEGYVVTEGILKGINTQAFTSGQLIYLGATGSIIGYAPVAPLHAVRLGEVIRHQSNNGSIYVRIDNGYELSELHDVLITSPISGQSLVRSGSIWINSNSLTGSLFGTSSWANNAITASYVQISQTASYVLNAVSASYAPSFPVFPYNGSATITGSLTVTGSIYTNSTIYAPFIIALNFETVTSYIYKAPYGFYVSSSESDPSGSITIEYQSSGSAVTSSYIYGNTINKYDKLIITPITSSLIILNSIRI